MSKTNGNGKNGKNGHPHRDEKGYFLPGNPGGPGNPHAKTVHKFRSLILRATTEDEMLEIWEVLKDKARGGDMAAIREVFDRILGKSKESVEVSGDSKHTIEVVRAGLDKLAQRFSTGDIGLS